jgi:hypothetical protein
MPHRLAAIVVMSQHGVLPRQRTYIAKYKGIDTNVLFIVDFTTQINRRFAVKSLWNNREELFNWYENLSTVDQCAVNAWLTSADDDEPNTKLLSCVARRVFVVRLRVVPVTKRFVIKKLA